MSLQEGDFLQDPHGVRKLRTTDPRQARRFSARLVSLHEDMHRRISSELHDSTCQQLVAASLSVMRLRAVKGDPHKLDLICDEIDAALDQALKELRTFTYLLQPKGLLPGGLRTTIQQYAEAFAERTLLKIGVSIPADVDSLSCEKQVSLLRVVQEALTNVFRHAKATQVAVAIDTSGGAFELTVRDDGCGMPLDQMGAGVNALSTGVGIPAMTARLQEMGGALEIRSGLMTGHAGTVLRAVFPCDPAGRKRHRQKRDAVGRSGRGRKTSRSD